MNYEALLDRILADGIAEVRVAYDDPKEHYKRDGAIEGFEACRGKTPGEIVALWTRAEQRAAQIARERPSTSTEEIHVYMRQRYKALQLEFVLNVLSVGLEAPLLAHLPTTRGLMKYTEIISMRDEGVSA